MTHQGEKSQRSVAILNGSAGRLATHYLTSLIAFIVELTTIKTLLSDDTPTSITQQTIKLASLIVYRFQSLLRIVVILHWVISALATTK